MGKPLFAYAKTKMQISCAVNAPTMGAVNAPTMGAVNAQLISTLVFANRIVQSLYYLNPKFQASSHLLWLYRPVCVGPGRKPLRPFFSQRGLFLFTGCQHHLVDQDQNGSTALTLVQRFLCQRTPMRDLGTSAYQLL